MRFYRALWKVMENVTVKTFFFFLFLMTIVGEHGSYWCGRLYNTAFYKYRVSNTVREREWIYRFFVPQRWETLLLWTSCVGKKYWGWILCVKRYNDQSDCNLQPFVNKNMIKYYFDLLWKTVTSLFVETGWRMLYNTMCSRSQKLKVGCQFYQKFLLFWNFFSPFMSSFCSHFVARLCF